MVSNIPYRIYSLGVYKHGNLIPLRRRNSTVIQGFSESKMLEGLGDGKSQGRPTLYARGAGECYFSHKTLILEMTRTRISQSADSLIHPPPTTKFNH